jgi:hypothetical protein
MPWLQFLRRKVAELSHRDSPNSLSAKEKAQLRRSNALAGLRELPFPFGSAIAIVSDVDASSRARYDAYAGTLVSQLGFDFGDSTWLRWRYAPARGEHSGGDVFGFFSRYFNTGRAEAPEQFDRTRTFFESLTEYHIGNVDHFHSFLSRGPRVAIADNVISRNNTAEIELHDFQDKGPWSCSDVFIVAVCAVGHAGKSVRPRTVRVHEADRSHEYRESEVDLAADGRERRVFAHATLGAEDATIPELSKITKVILEFENPADARNVDAILLLDGYGPVLLERLAVLRDRFNVEIQLITEHAGQHFRAPKRAEQADALLQAHPRSGSGPVEAYNGTLVDRDGRFLFSTAADDPRSFSRVLTDLCDNFEVRFLLQQAASHKTGWDPLDLVAPLRTRTGAKVYEVRRMSPPLSQDRPRAKTRTRQSTFAARLTRVLTETTEQAGLFWPIYTHLGGIDQESSTFSKKMGRLSDAQERQALPSPYFSWEPLHELQERVFNFSGTTDTRSRFWFTRASVLYDYALMVKTIVAHIKRPDANTIAISSWTDAVLNKVLPRSPGQLYGLTFYVDDPSKACVLLDEMPIDALVRNPADETGRYSVTIGEAEIRTTLLGRVDPASNSPEAVQTSHADWRWIRSDSEERAYGRLIVRTADAPAKFRLSLFGLQAKGAQITSFAARSSVDTRFALLLETRTGGRFFIGHESLLHDIDGVTARYHFDHHDMSPDRWHVLLTPLHDLLWAKGAKPGGPMPSHALDALTIIARGDTGASLDIADVAFLRPRTMALSTRSDRRFCLGGHIKSFTPGQRVHIEAQEGAGISQTESVDQRGYFCFPQIAAGIYRVWSDIEGKTFHDLRGPLVEVNADRMDLVIDK